MAAHIRKRNLLKKIASASVIASTLPSGWIKPIVSSVILPVHAQTSDLNPSLNVPSVSITTPAPTTTPTPPYPVVSPRRSSGAPLLKQETYVRWTNFTVDSTNAGGKSFFVEVIVYNGTPSESIIEFHSGIDSTKVVDIFPDSGEPSFTYDLNVIWNF